MHSSTILYVSLCVIRGWGESSSQGLVLPFRALISRGPWQPRAQQAEGQMPSSEVASAFPASP